MLASWLYLVQCLRFFEAVSAVQLTVKRACKDTGPFFGVLFLLFMGCNDFFYFKKTFAGDKWLSEYVKNFAV